MRNIRVWRAAALAAVALVGASEAGATVIRYDLSSTVEGTTPSGFPSIIFDDHGSTGLVDLFIDASGLSGGEFISGLFFNFAGAGSRTLVFTRTGGTGPAPTAVHQSSNGRDTPGDQGLYDIEFAFSTSNAGGGINRFNADETLSYSISGAGITASSFSQLSAYEHGRANYALARIQGIAGGGSASVADRDGPSPSTPVPEPATLGLLGLGALALAGYRRRGARPISD